MYIWNNTKLVLKLEMKGRIFITVIKVSSLLLFRGVFRISFFFFFFDSTQDIEGLGKANGWGPDELINIEQRILSSTCPPLCLDPTPKGLFPHYILYNFIILNYCV
jgi:hypothetical protein